MAYSFFNFGLFLDKFLNKLIYFSFLHVCSLMWILFVPEPFWRFTIYNKNGLKKLKPDSVPTLFDVPNKPCPLTEKRQKGIGCPKPGSFLHNTAIEKVVLLV